jgi:hypothetical protein
MAGVTAFREAYFSTDMDANEQASFASFEARKLRYAVLWAYFENTAYRDIHTWARRMRVDYGLYQYVRNIYNPAYRIGDFWAIHTMGGALDRAAGDGSSVPSALPIITENELLRPAIAQLWTWSNWQIGKEIMTLWGATLGDVGLQVVDDMARGKVYLKLVHPASIRDVTLDPFGNVKGYQIEDQREHPEKPGTTVTYSELASRGDGDAVVYETYLNGKPYAWNGQASAWEESYGFVPLVLIQHRNVGMGWGWSEFYPALSKIREVDDLASKTSDQVRKTVDGVWLFSGMTAPKTAPSLAGAPPTADNPEPGRQELKAIYSTAPGATAQALVAPLDLVGTMAHIQSILSELERDYPELRSDVATASGDASGRALRVARQRAEAKVMQRRTNYDDALVRAQQMAVAIGGLRGYEAFAGFGLDSYGRGELNHQIGDRPVFAVDPSDQAEADKMFWDTAAVAVKAGMPLGSFLRRSGWTEDEIAEYEGSPERQSRVAGMDAARLGLESLRGGETGGLFAEESV